MVLLITETSMVCLPLLLFSFGCAGLSKFFYKKVFKIPSFSKKGRHLSIKNKQGLVKKNQEIQEKLIAGARQGDRKSMYRLYQLYVQAMYNTCIRIVSNSCDAEDILQEAFISAFQNLGSFRGESSFGSWLKRIVVNKSVSSLRKKKDIELVGDVPDSHFQGEEPDFPDIAPSLVHEAIKQLPEKARAVLVLHMLEGYKHREVAEILGISESTSKSQCQRALLILKEKITKEVNHEI